MLTELLISAAVPTKPIVRTRIDTIISISVKPRWPEPFTGLRGDCDVSIIGHLNSFLRYRSGETGIRENHLNRVHGGCAADSSARSERQRHVLVEGHTLAHQRHGGADIG